MYVGGEGVYPGTALPLPDGLSRDGNQQAASSSQRDLPPSREGDFPKKV